MRTILRCFNFVTTIAHDYCLLYKTTSPHVRITRHADNSHAFERGKLTAGDSRFSLNVWVVQFINSTAHPRLASWQFGRNMTVPFCVAALQLIQLILILMLLMLADSSTCLVLALQPIRQQAFWPNTKVLANDSLHKTQQQHTASL